MSGPDPIEAAFRDLDVPIAARVLVIADTDEVAAAIDTVQGFAGESAHLTGVDIGATDRAVADTSPHAVYVAVVEHGPFDLIVDASAQPPEVRRAVFGNGFFGLRPGGTYLHVGAAPRTPPGTVAADVAAARALSQRIIAAVRRATLPRLELTRAVRRASSTSSALVVTKSGEHLPKVRDTTANELLATARPGRVRVLEAIDPVRFRSQASATMHGATGPMNRFATEYEVPPLWLREYRGVTVLPGQVALLDGLVLPDTYRHNQADRLRTTQLADSAHHYARLRAPLREVEDLSGAYYYLDSEFGGRYGHLLTEQLGRVWGWDRAAAEYADLRVLVSSEDPSARLEREILSAFGVPADRVVVLTRPARVDTLIAASPMFQNPRYASPDLEPVWARVRDGLRSAASGGADAVHGRIFVTRRGTDGRRECRNASEVETWFAARGFDVVDPGALSLADQADLFARAEVVAGFGGSALINGVFGTRSTRRIVITHDGYTARNEHLIACLYGDEQHYFWSRPEIEHPPGGWSVEAFHSPFTFDLDRAAGDLEALVA